MRLAAYQIRTKYDDSRRGTRLSRKYRYRLYHEDGSEAGEAHYAVMIRPGETIHTGDGRRLRVLDVVPTDENLSEYVGLLKVEAA